MNWIEIAIAVLGTGSIGYLIVEKLFTRKLDRAAVKEQEIENSSQIAKLYNEIDAIVEKKTTPIYKEMAAVKKELRESREDLAELRQHWCCYRESCNDRLLVPVSGSQASELLLGNN